MSIERWRWVMGLEGRYEISDWGRVRSVRRTVTDRLGRKRQWPALIMRTVVRKSGHIGVTLSAHGRHIPRDVHQLVAEAFLGVRPAGMQIRHLDGDPANNNISNLAYGTCSENQYDRVRRGRDHNARKTACKRGHPFDEANTYRTATGNRQCRACIPIRRRLNGTVSPDGSNVPKLIEKDVIEIRRRAASGEKQVALAAEFGVRRLAIGKVVRRRTWRHVGEGIAEDAGIPVVRYEQGEDR